MDMDNDFHPFKLGRYHCVRKIGSGGMAEVYLAKLNTVEGFQKTFALKKIHNHLAHSSDFSRMFFREARISATLDHGNIVRVTELNKDKGTYFIVMEYVDGVDLKTLLRFVASLQRTVPWDLAVYIIMEITRGLEYAHSNTDENGIPRGIVHRDLSPSNIIISEHGEIKILDFGIARALLSDESSRQSTMTGKYAYMSPEQIRSEELDGRSDIFALGALFYEILTGEKLFEGNTVLDTIRNVENVTIPENFGVDSSLEPILHKMLSPNPTDRFTTAGELMNTLSRTLVIRRISVIQTDMAAYLSGAKLRAERIKKKKAEAPEVSVTSPSPRPPVFSQTTGVTVRDKKLTGNKEPMTSSVVLLKAPDKEPCIQPQEESSFDDKTTSVYEAVQQMASIDDFDDYEQTIVEPCSTPKNYKQEPPKVPSNNVSPSEKKGTTAPGEHLSQERSAQERSATHEKNRSITAKFGEREAAVPLEGYLKKEGNELLSKDKATMSPETEAVELLDSMYANRQARRPKYGVIKPITFAAVLVAITFVGFAFWLFMNTSWINGEDNATRPLNRRAGQAAKRKSSGSNEPNTANTNFQDADLLISKDGSESSLKTMNSLSSEDSGVNGIKDDNSEPELKSKLDKLQITSVGPILGRVKRGQLDIKTEPAGADVIIDTIVVGKTPVRLGLKPNRRYLIALNKQGRSVIVRRIKLRKRKARVIDVKLPPVKKPARKPRTGHTAVMVECEPPGVHRVYLNGWDTGYNCPVAFEVSVGKNNVGFRVPGTIKKMHYQNFSVRYGKLAEIKRRVSK